MPARHHLIIAAAILAIGWGVGIPIYLSGSDEESLPFELTTDSRKYMNQVERLGGKSGLFYQDLLDAFHAWSHGWRLGITIAAIASIVAVIYLWLAPADTGARR